MRKKLHWLLVWIFQSFKIDLLWSRFSLIHLMDLPKKRLTFKKKKDMEPPFLFYKNPYSYCRRPVLFKKLKFLLSIRCIELICFVFIFRLKTCNAWWSSQPKYCSHCTLENFSSSLKAILYVSEFDMQTINLHACIHAFISRCSKLHFTLINKKRTANFWGWWW